jgi:hypothetical protein
MRASKISTSVFLPFNIVLTACIMLYLSVRIGPELDNPNVFYVNEKWKENMHQLLELMYEAWSDKAMVAEGRWWTAGN